MKARTSVLTLALFFVAGAVCFASDAQMGTWKLNEAKSKLSAGMAKNSTIVFEASGDSVEHIYERGRGTGCYLRVLKIAPNHSLVTEIR